MLLIWAGYGSGHITLCDVRVMMVESRDNYSVFLAVMDDKQRH